MMLQINANWLGKLLHFLKKIFFKDYFLFNSNSLLSGVVFAETDDSVEAVFDLLDKDLFRDAVLLTEFPLLTAVARNRHPSLALINKFKAYLASKDSKFIYLQKSYLIYSALIKTFCAENDCSASLDDWTLILRNIIKVINILRIIVVKLVFKMVY